MKATGIVRRVDDLGRVVIPKELRKTLGLQEGDGLELFVDGENIILHKYSPACIFCGEAEGVEEFHGRRVCPGCAKELSIMFKLNVLDKSKMRVG